MSHSKKQQHFAMLRGLVWLTLLLIFSEATFFFAHYKVSILIDAMIKSSIITDLGSPVVLWPIVSFLFIQFLAYIWLVGAIFFLALCLSEFACLSYQASQVLGALLWLFTTIFIFSLNQYYFPHSFFAFIDVGLNLALLFLSGIVLLVACALAYFYSFRAKRFRLFGMILLMVVIAIFIVQAPLMVYKPKTMAKHLAKPNIIIIGLDSLRPDYVHELSHSSISTPNIDHFLQTATVYTNAYTPLARTFPAWISLLTSLYPRHHHARNNLASPTQLILHETLAKTLQQAGYETIYASDEKRFSNITKDEGFAELIGPKMGVNDFLLGGLNDFPLTNLLIHLPIGQFLFPYHYGNRAASITYEPDSFLQMLKTDLKRPTEKPIFLAVHLCLAHWPYTFARDGSRESMTLADHYRISVQALDNQFGKLLQILADKDLLSHSIMVLLSDHGTTLGLPNDRLIEQKNYRGNLQKLTLIKVSKLSGSKEFSVNLKHDYVIDTSYGQGTDVLSLKQYHIVLAFKGLGLPVERRDVQVSLMDVAPTLLDYLHLTPLKHADGLSLLKPIPTRAFFMETGDSLSEIETDHIYLEKVVAGKIGIYRINLANGLLYIDPRAEAGIIKNKQRAILLDKWLLARYPASSQMKLIAFTAEKGAPLVAVRTTLPPYFVLINLVTGHWRIDLSAAWLKRAPLAMLMRQWQAFYGDEV